MKKILVIDDDVRGRNLVKEVLEKYGYSAILAEDGTEGLYLAKKEMPSLILLDIALADVDGIEVCKRFKEVEKLRSVPILMLSGMDDNRMIDIAMKAGAAGFISKPYDIKTLLGKIREIIH